MWNVWLRFGRSSLSTVIEELGEPRAAAGGEGAPAGPAPIAPFLAQVVQLLGGEGLDAILPTRGARTWGGAKANKAIVSTQLGKLAFGSAVTEGNVEAPRHETQTYDAPVEKDDGLGVGGVSVEVVEDEASVGAEEGLGPKMRTSRAFNRVLRKYSEESALVMTNLPLPRDADSPQEYMAHLDALVADVPRVLLVAGQKDADVVTMYS